MSENLPETPIRNAKLYRPPVTADYIPRDDLEVRLQQGADLPLTIVSAPAGYGKSTTISHWLESSELPSAWISLDETDSDLVLFLNYFIAAIRSIYKHACQETLAMLNAGTLPPVQTLAAYLGNDLEELEQRMILVLDDYYHIRSEAIHTLLDTLLQHPPQQLHIAILTRRDPVLSLASYRARHLLTEIRMRDLEFSSQETQSLLQRFIGHPLAAGALEKLQHNTEGWPVGVRLAALAMRHQDDKEGFLERFGADSRPLQDYLVSEVLNALSPAMRERLMYSAILKHFNAFLCEAVWGDDISANSEVLTGSHFIETIEASEVFCIALDARHEWYRFHHLFRELLARELEISLGAGKIAELHERASDWLAEHGFFEEAAHHALAGGNGTAAAEIIGEARHALMSSDQWRRLESWLKLFPEQVVEKQPQLLLLRCWLDYHLWYRMDLFAQDVQMVEDLIGGLPSKTKGIKALRGEVSSLSIILAYSACDPERCIELADSALADVPAKQECVRSTALHVKIHAYQMLGDLAQSDVLLWDAMDSEAFPAPSSKARFLMAACFTAWTEADAGRLRQAGRKLLKVSEKHQLPWCISFAHYFLGIADYDDNRLAEAMAHFEIVAGEPYLHQLHNVVSCWFLLSLSQQALHSERQAITTAELISSHIFDLGHKALSDSIRAFQAELDLRQNNITKACRWLSSYEPPPPHVMHRFYNPEFTAVKIMLLLNTRESRDKARKLLSEMHKNLSRVNHKRMLIDTLALLAILDFRDGNESAAIDGLSQAILIGQPSHLIRPFTDIGTELIPILNRLDIAKDSLEYIGEIVASMQSPGEKRASSAPQSLDILSQRELDIMRLLAQDFSNKDIAKKLFISTGTVKRHAHNIYGKLAVNGRREAVSKATGLGILNTQ